MNKIEVLKQHNPQLGLSFIEVVKQLYPKNKYIELIINLTKYHYKSSKDADKERRDLIDYMYRRHAIPLEELESINNCDLRYINQMLDFIPYRIRETLPKFIEYNERGLIENKDLTSYNDIEDVLRQISIAELKSINKELAKQIHKVYEDEEWLVLRPLSREASLKYGAGTKWCTASTEDDWPYYRYTRRGILIYTMNKKTGQKVATFKDIRDEQELSFWNEIDTRIDSYEAGLPKFIMEIIFSEIKSTLTNEDMAPEECKMRDHEKEMLAEPMPEPMNELVATPRLTYPLTSVNVDIAREALEQEIINHLQDEQH